MASLPNPHAVSRPNPPPSAPEPNEQPPRPESCHAIASATAEAFRRSTGHPFDYLLPTDLPSPATPNRSPQSRDRPDNFTQNPPPACHAVPSHRSNHRRKLAKAEEPDVLQPLAIFSQRFVSPAQVALALLARQVEGNCTARTRRATVGLRLRAVCLRVARVSSRSLLGTSQFLERTIRCEKPIASSLPCRTKPKHPAS